jgi:hypothetical protein
MIKLMESALDSYEQRLKLKLQETQTIIEHIKQDFSIVLLPHKNSLFLLFGFTKIKMMLQTIIKLTVSITFTLMQCQCEGDCSQSYMAKTIAQ